MDLQPTYSQLPPLSLYVHIPWCVRKCPYCDFNSHASKQALPERDYVAQLIADLEADLHFVQDRPLTSIFIGGGTPSLFSAQSIADLLQAIEQRIAFSPTVEITLEANPGTFEQEKFSGFFQAGVNRLSIGIQSFNNDALVKLGRIHDANQALTAAQMAKAAGFTNFNLDLMHGLPGQTATQALADLQQAIELQPKHLSWYQLTIEPNTEFYNRVPALPEEDTLWQIFTDGQQLLADHDFVQYEVSAYAQAGQHSRHNLNYWQFGDYLGIGAGAHGKITLLEQQQIIRTLKTRLPNDYLRNPTPRVNAQQAIAAEDLAGEFIMNALRLNQGFTANNFEQRTGLPVSTITAQIDSCRRMGLLETDEPIRASAQGRLFLNDLVARFID